ncbi:hypothetical protein BYT27DRAFT_7182382 [Phlegmacium glaucopus]|nr:hypothetical protein BYT27DRAFT_7182382 [Phlegmacium glaucopus]
MTARNSGAQLHVPGPWISCKIKVMALQGVLRAMAHFNQLLRSENLGLHPTTKYPTHLILETPLRHPYSLLPGNKHIPQHYPIAQQQQLTPHPTSPPLVSSTSTTFKYNYVQPTTKNPADSHADRRAVCQ